MLLRHWGWRPCVQLTSLSALSSFCVRGLATSHIGTSSPSSTKLDDIMKMDTLMDKSPDEVEDIWLKVRRCAAPLQACPVCAMQLRTESGDGCLRIAMNFRCRAVSP